MTQKNSFLSNRQSINSALKSKNNNNYNIHIVNEVSENKETSIIKKNLKILKILFQLNFLFLLKKY